uniref:Uncharacterized protein n=1 Tax=Astyanax mexicanus TaxID=7994 RepID=A0A8B9GSB4_ASTMX
MSKRPTTTQMDTERTDTSIIRIPPHHYIHVLDQNTNIARVEIGPLTYIRQDNERPKGNRGCANSLRAHNFSPLLWLEKYLFYLIFILKKNPY